MLQVYSCHLSLPFNTLNKPFRLRLKACSGHKQARFHLLLQTLCLIHCRFILQTRATLGRDGCRPGNLLRSPRLWMEAVLASVAQELLCVGSCVGHSSAQPLSQRLLGPCGCDSTLPRFPQKLLGFCRNPPPTPPAGTFRSSNSSPTA